MKFAGRFATLALSLCMFATAAYAAHSHVPTPSTWTLNVAESNFDGGPAMKSDVYVMLIDTEKMMKFTEVQVDAAGNKTEFSWGGVPDGKMHPYVGMSGATGSYMAASDSGHMEMADGTVVDEVITYSADKKKATMMVLLKDKTGHAYQQTWVYDRTK